MSTFKIDVLKKLSKVNSSYVHICPQKIVNRRGSEIAVVYQPPEPMFEKDFSVHSLSDFLSLVTMFDDVALDFKGERIVIRDAKTNSSITYVTIAEKLMEEHIQRDTRGENLVKICEKMKMSKAAVKFVLTEGDIQTLTKMGSILKANNTPSKITLEKRAGESEVIINVKCDQNENSYETSRRLVHPLDNETVEVPQKEIFAEDVKKIRPFSYSINLDTLIAGTWDCFIFETDGYDEKTKKNFIQFDKDKIPAIFMYLENKEENMKMIITYIQKQEKKPEETPAA